MSTTTAPDQDRLPVPAPTSRLYRMSVEQYDHLARVGILGRDDRIELIEGLLVEKMTKNERHLTTTWLFDQALARLLPQGWFAVTESPVRLERSEPEPDVMIVRGQISDYFHRKPRAADVALVIEVSDSSYAEDRARCSLYAAGGIPAYWIANLPASRIEAYSDPSGPGASPEYRSRRDYGWIDEIPLMIEGIMVASLAVRDLMPPTAQP